MFVTPDIYCLAPVGVAAVPLQCLACNLHQACIFNKDFEIS
jgi:hypothetical protein